MTPYITLLPFLVLANEIHASVWLNNKSIKIQSKNPGELDLNAIRAPNPDQISNLTISHVTILNANYTPLKKFRNLRTLNLTDVTGAPRITKDLFRNTPELKIFILFAKESYNEVEFEEDAFDYANKLEFFYVERLYTVSRLSSRFLGRSLKNLQRLTVDNGALSVIEANAFDFANNLDYLSVTGHGSIKIEKDAFKKLMKLRALYLDGNDILDFSWDNFGVVPSVNVLTLSNVNPGKINAIEIKKYFPKLLYLIVYTDNCKQYKDVTVLSKGLIILFSNPNNVPCFKLQPI